MQPLLHRSRWPRAMLDKDKFSASLHWCLRHNATINLLAGKQLGPRLLGQDGGPARGLCRTCRACFRRQGRRHCALDAGAHVGEGAANEAAKKLGLSGIGDFTRKGEAHAAIRVH
jgi:hypothetical protein